MQRLRGRLRPLLAPELIDQALAPDDLVRVQQQDREQLALPAAADDERPIAVERLRMGRGSGTPFRAVERRYHATARPSLPSSYPPLPTPGAADPDARPANVQQARRAAKGVTPMITSSQKRNRAARRVALGLVLAGTLVGAAPARRRPTTATSR